MNFQYKARGNDGSIKSGYFDTQSQGQVVAWLRSQGLVPISISQAKEGSSESLLEKMQKISTVKLKDKAVYPTVFCHHVTVLFGVYENDERVQKLLKIGDMSMVTDGIYKDEKGQAVKVNPSVDHVAMKDDVTGYSDLFKEIGKTQNYHVTISTQEGVPPVYSNELLKNPHSDVEPFKETLRGTLEFFRFGSKG